MAEPKDQNNDNLQGMDGMNEEETENRKKIRIKNIDMSQEMKEAAIKCAKDAIDKYDIEQDIADYIRYEFDKRYSEELPQISKNGGAGWHCIVGR